MSQDTQYPKTTVVRYTVKPGRETENQELVQAVYRELAEARPSAFNYATFRLDGGRTFVHVAAVLAPTDEFPLTELESFKRFRAGLDERVEAPLERNDGALVGAYRSA